MRSGKIPKTSVTEMGREKSWHRAKACGGHKQLAEQTPGKKAARPSPPLAQRRPQGCRSAPVVLAAARAAGRWWEQTGHVSAASCALPLQALGGREAARLAPTMLVGEHPGRGWYQVNLSLLPSPPQRRAPGRCEPRALHQLPATLPPGARHKGGAKRTPGQHDACPWRRMEHCVPTAPGTTVQRQRAPGLDFNLRREHRWPWPFPRRQRRKNISPLLQK